MDNNNYYLFLIILTNADIYLKGGVAATLISLFFVQVRLLIFHLTKKNVACET